ncbi:MAG: GNAT family N-acetyltransferase [bacterium]
MGLASLMRTRERWAGCAVDVLRSMTNDWSYRYGFLARDHREDVYAALWRGLFTADGCDAVVLDWLPEDYRTLRSALETAGAFDWNHDVFHACDSPSRRLPSPPEPWNKGLKSKFKSNLRNRERRLRAAGLVEFDVVRYGDGFADALNKFYSLESMGWKGERGTAILMQPEAKAFFDSYVRRAASHIQIPILSLDGTPVAAQLIRVDQGTMYLFKTAFDPAFSRYSPGQLITARAMQYGIDHGMETYDFLGVAMHWKTDWAPELRSNVQAVFCSPSATGRYVFMMRHGIKNHVKRVPGAVPLARWLRSKGDGA